MVRAQRSKAHRLRGELAEPPSRVVGPRQHRQRCAEVRLGERAFAPQQPPACAMQVVVGGVSEQVVPEAHVDRPAVGGRTGGDHGVIDQLVICGFVRQVVSVGGGHHAQGDDAAGELVVEPAKLLLRRRPSHRQVRVGEAALVQPRDRLLAPVLGGRPAQPVDRLQVFRPLQADVAPAEANGQPSVGDRDLQDHGGHVIQVAHVQVAVGPLQGAVD